MLVLRAVALPESIEARSLKELVLAEHLLLCNDLFLFASRPLRRLCFLRALLKLLFSLDNGTFQGDLPEGHLRMQIVWSLGALLRS